MHLRVCPGDFVTQETVLADVWSSHPLEEAALSVLRQCVIVLNQRDMMQDADIGIRQLADIALRVMSPAVNDLTTAVNCIRYLQALFEHLAQRALPSAIHHFRDGSSILMMRYRTFQEYLQVCLEIGRVTTDNARVADALLAALEATLRIALQKGQEPLPLLGAMAKAIAHPTIEDARTALDRTLLVERLNRIEQMTQVRIEHIPRAEQTTL